MKLNKEQQLQFTSAIERLTESLYYKTDYPHEPITESLEKLTNMFPGLKKNKKWVNMCFNYDSKRAEVYIEPEKEKLLQYHGKELLKWDAKDITLDHLWTAMNAKEPLTFLQAIKCKKIKPLIKNEWIYKKYLETYKDGNLENETRTSILDTYLIRAWNKNGTSFKTLTKAKTVQDWIQALNIKALFMYSDKQMITDPKFIAKINERCKLLAVPTKVMGMIHALFEFCQRYKTDVAKQTNVRNPYLTNWTTISPVKVFQNPDEEAELQVYAKLQGFRYANNVVKSSVECGPYFDCAVAALYYYLFAKTN